MKETLIQMLRKQFAEENEGDNIFIIRKSDVEFYAFDKNEIKFYFFAFDKTSNEKDSNEIPLVIINLSTKKYVEFGVPLEKFQMTSSAKGTIQFAEDYIAQFKSSYCKETI